jgi:hypothetical protein
MKKTTVILPLLILLGGCGPIWYATKIINARKYVAAARENGAGRETDDFAKYEITFAEEHLKKAQEEVAKADYQAAIELAAVAEEYGKKARDIAVRLKMEAGRTKKTTESESESESEKETDTEE